MFVAKSHPLLVPFDGALKARKAPTAPAKDKNDWKARLLDEAEALGDAQHRLFADEAATRGADRVPSARCRR